MEHNFIISLTKNQPLYEGQYTHFEYCLHINSEEDSISFDINIEASEKEIIKLAQDIEKRESTHILLYGYSYQGSLELVMLSADFSNNKFTWSYSYPLDMYNLKGEDKYKLKEEIPLSESFYSHLLFLLKDIILK